MEVMQIGFRQCLSTVLCAGVVKHTTDYYTRCSSLIRPITSPPEEVQSTAITLRVCGSFSVYHRCKKTFK